MSGSKEQQLWDACTSGNLESVKRLANDPTVDINWIGPERNDTPLHRACRFCHRPVAEVLLKHSKVNVNAGNAGKATPFSLACQEGHQEIVSLLLGDLRIDVNKLEKDDSTPFFMACQQGHKEMVSLLLADLRIDLNRPKKHRTTPLWIAAFAGHLPVVQFILVSGREVNTKTKSIAGTMIWNDKTAPEVAWCQGTRPRLTDELEADYLTKKQNGPLIAALLDSFDADSVTTRQQLRELPELRDAFISDLFALVVFLCDDLLTVRTESSPSSDTTKKAARFFQIAQSLPMELQMVLCSRVFGSSKDIVLTKHSEPAFKKLVILLARTTR